MFRAVRPIPQLPAKEAAEACQTSELCLFPCLTTGTSKQERLRAEGVMLQCLQQDHMSVPDLPREMPYRHMMLSPVNDRQVQLNASFRELWLVISALGETMWWGAESLQSGM